MTISCKKMILRVVLFANKCCIAFRPVDSVVMMFQRLCTTQSCCFLVLVSAHLIRPLCKKIQVEKLSKTLLLQFNVKLSSWNEFFVTLVHWCCK